MEDKTPKALEQLAQRDWNQTCGTWENCNEETVKSFLSLTLSHNLDPQFSMGWIEKNKEKIPQWNEISEAALEWMNAHTSSGSPYTR